MAKKTYETIEYTYMGTDNDGKTFSVTYRPGDLKSDGKPFTEEEIIIMRDADHREYLGNRYWDEIKSSLAEIEKRECQDENSDFHHDPVENHKDWTYNPENILFADRDKKNDEAAEKAARIAAKRMRMLRKALKTLSEDEAKLYLHLYEKNISMREYGRMIEKTEGTIRYRHKKMLAKIQKLL